MGCGRDGRAGGGDEDQLQFEMVVVEAEDREFVEFLHGKIREFNDEQSLHHRAVRQPGAIQPLNLLLNDHLGATVGGLAARTYWDWLEIEYLYVPAAARRHGVGARLLQQAESIALTRGCAHVQLTTFEFQARRFYEQQGYRVVGALEGYPPGSTYYWMRKDLTSSAELPGERGR